MEAESSLPYSQVPATSPYPEHFPKLYIKFTDIRCCVFHDPALAPYVIDGFPKFRYATCITETYSFSQTYIY